MHYKKIKKNVKGLLLKKGDARKTDTKKRERVVSEFSLTVGKKTGGIHIPL
jgi:hypothetical protein